MEMTQEWIDQYNKKCAEFIGAKPCKDWQGYDGYEHPDWYHTQWSNRYQDNLDLYSYKYSDLQFDSDWNWIMKVVDKIHVIPHKEDWFSLIEFNAKKNQVVGRLGLGSKGKEEILQSIDQFIDWYNKQKES